MENPNLKRMSFRESTSDSGLRLMPEMFKLRLNQSIDETLDALNVIWKEAGYEDIECQQLLGDFFNQLKLTCTNKLAAEEKILEHAKMHVKSNIEDLKKMHEQLGRVADVSHIESLNYTEKLNELERMLKEIGSEVSGRQTLFDKEMFAITSMAKELGEVVPTDNSYQGPPGTPFFSDVRLQLMRNHRKELEGIKVKRIEEVQTLAKECYAHMCDLMYSEEGFATMEDSQTYLTLDKQVVKFAKTGEFAIGISKKDVIQLTNRFKRFLEEKEQRRTELEKTGAEIAKLWSLLRIPSVEREQFQNSFKKNLSMETLNKGKDELKRLRDIRRRSLGRVVASIRSDIVTLWDEAGIESEENRRREFPMFFNDLEGLDDAAVDIHEAYFTSLRKRVEELKPMLIKISRRETVIQERIELEHLQMNPERLTARGPNAREERKREEGMQNRVKNLDRLTKEIISQIQAWEEINGPFIYGGERYLERIPQQEEFYHEFKESLRSARRKKDGKMDATVASTRPLTATKRQNATVGGISTPSTPYSAAKHKTLDHSVLSSASHANIGTNQKESENQPPSSNTRSASPLMRKGSNDTMITSATQVKDRDSQSSDTIINGH